MINQSLSCKLKSNNTEAKFFANHVTNVELCLIPFKDRGSLVCILCLTNSFLDIVAQL